MKGDTSFGVALREARMRVGASQLSVATLIRREASHISEIEHGRRGPFAYPQVLSVAHFLDASPARMLSKWACWMEEVPMCRTGDERKDLVAAALSVEWATLSPQAIDRIAREVGL